MASISGPGGVSPSYIFTANNIFTESDLAVPKEFGDWIENIERQTTNESRMKAIQEVPKTPLSTMGFEKSPWRGRLKSSFKDFNFKEMRALLSWMHDEGKPFIHEAADWVSPVRASRIGILFSGFIDSLVDRGLLGEFSKLSEYKFLDEAYFPKEEESGF